MSIYRSKGIFDGNELLRKDEIKTGKSGTTKITYSEREKSDAQIENNIDIQF